MLPNCISVHMQEVMFAFCILLLYHADPHTFSRSFVRTPLLASGSWFSGQMRALLSLCVAIAMTLATAAPMLTTVVALKEGHTWHALETEGVGMRAVPLLVLRARFHLVFAVPIVGGAAMCQFSDTIATQGAATLNCSTSSAYSDRDQMFGLGFAEGVATQLRISQHAANLKEELLDGSPDGAWDAVRKFYATHLSWVQAQIEDRKSTRLNSSH